MAVCPVEAISREEHCIVVHTDKCIGCKSCMDACPFGAIDMVPVTGCIQADGSEKKVANKCDLCIGNPGGPACVRVCPTEALTLVTEEELGGAMELKRMEAARNTFRETCAPE
jgi:electron transport protein HydN